MFHGTPEKNLKSYDVLHLPCTKILLWVSGGGIGGSRRARSDEVMRRTEQKGSNQRNETEF